MINIALVGIPNVGKTVLFEALAAQGKKVSGQKGKSRIFATEIFFGDQDYKVTNLSSGYSLFSDSDKSSFTRDFLLTQNIDCLIQVVDSQRKHKSFQLSLELMELEVPLFLVFIDPSRETNELCDKTKSVLHLNCSPLSLDSDSLVSDFLTPLDPLPVVNEYLPVCHQVHHNLKKELDVIQTYYHTPSLWHTIKLLENDPEIIREFSAENIEDLLRGESVTSCDLHVGYDELVDRNRSQFVKKHLTGSLPQQAIHKFSDAIDLVALNPLFGIPLFLGFMWLVFETTFSLGAYPMGWIDQGVGTLQQLILERYPFSWGQSLVSDGIVGGVGAALTFLPPILILVFFLGLIQQSGYFARVAFLLDSFMRRIDLQGKSFIPLLMGFGCNVPAIMAIRSLETVREKTITAMMVPFMSCGARLPIYTLFIAAFFPQKWQGTILFFLYLLGVAAGFLSGMILNKTLPGKPRPLLLEVPPYKIPNFRRLANTCLSKAKLFLLKAGKIILPFSILLWFLFSYPLGSVNELGISGSYASVVGKALEPLFSPLGFDWRVVTGLIAGLGAKEIMVSVFGTFYSLETGSTAGLIQALKSDPFFNPLNALSLLVFVLIYTPCIGVIGILKQELGLKWAIVGFLYPTFLAWLLAFVVYQGGNIILAS